MIHSWNIPVLNRKKYLSISCPSWATDNILHDTLITWALYKTHGGLDSHLSCHAFLNLYLGIQKLEISSIK